MDPMAKVMQFFSLLLLGAGFVTNEYMFMYMYLHVNEVIHLVPFVQYIVVAMTYIRAHNFHFT